MTLVKCCQPGDFSDINKHVKKFLVNFGEPFFTDPFFKNFNTSVYTPRVDVTEDKENLYVIADLPGVDKKDVKVNVVGDVLTISGEKKTEQRDENKNYYRVERSSGSFSRSFTLPAEIVVDKIAAEYKDGLLTITLPKTEEAKVVEKQVEIK